jgi:hypothetical protein
MDASAQLPQLNVQVKNTLLEASLVTDSDSEEELFLHYDAYSKRQVTDPPPTTNTILQPKNSKGLEDSTGVYDTPKVPELFEPELEPDLQPYAHAGMVRMVTEEQWCTWNDDSRQWEPDMEQSCFAQMRLDLASKRRCWADLTDDAYEFERKPDKPMEKVAIALSPALGIGVTTDTPMAPNPYQSVHAIAASALLGCTFIQGQQSVAQQPENSKSKTCRRRNRNSLIDQAARQIKKEANNKKQPQTEQPLVPMFCHQCGGRCTADYKFCRYCGVAAIGEA